MTMGIVHEFDMLTRYPIATGAIAPPTFAKVFMHPVTVPAYSPPMSWQTDHAGVNARSAIPAAAASRNAAARGLEITAAAASAAPLTARAIAATPHRPVLRPYFRDQRSVQTPPSTLAAAPDNNTMLDSQLAADAEKPRPSRR